MRKTLFWLYAAFIVFFVIFKFYESPIERIEYLTFLRTIGYDNVNTEVFRTIKMCIVNINTVWAVINLAGNTIPFLFLGVITRITWKKHECKELFYAVSSALLILEIMQYIFLLGTCDIDDVILNLSFLKIGISLIK